MNSRKRLTEKVLSLIHDDFDDLTWFRIASEEMVKTIYDFSRCVENEANSFHDVKDAVGSIGQAIHHVEEMLDEVENCYNQLVEIVSEAAESEDTFH